MLSSSSPFIEKEVTATLWQRRAAALQASRRAPAASHGKDSAADDVVKGQSISIHGPHLMRLLACYRAMPAP